MRFSTSPADILDDSVSIPRGLAIKLFDVNVDYLSAESAAQAQDFLLLNAPAFMWPNIKGFAKKIWDYSIFRHKFNGSSMHVTNRQKTLDEQPKSP